MHEKATAAFQFDRSCKESSPAGLAGTVEIDHAPNAVDVESPSG